MTLKKNGQPSPYQVVTSAVAKEALLQLRRQAAEAGKGEQFMAALRQIGKRLESAPTELGEPIFNLPALKLVVHHAVVLPLVVIFGIHQEQHLVFIRRFKVLA